MVNAHNLLKIILYSVLTVIKTDETRIHIYLALLIVITFCLLEINYYQKSTLTHVNIILQSYVAIHNYIWHIFLHISRICIILDCYPIIVSIYTHIYIYKHKIKTPICIKHNSVVRNLVQKKICHFLYIYITYGIICLNRSLPFKCIGSSHICVLYFRKTVADINTRPNRVQ